MKNLFLVVFNLIMAIGMFAQQRQNQRMSTVYITASGNKNLQVSIDGTVYNIAGNGNTSKLITPITTLSTGMHSLTFSRTNNNNRRNNDVTTQFNLRRNFDMYINVTANGALELIEKRTGGATASNMAMSTSNFNMVMRDLRLQRSTLSRNDFLTTTFNRPNTYFSTAQVVQLLQQVRNENDRLPLAKLSFRTVTDPTNFGAVYNLFTSTNRTNLEDYVYDYTEEQVDVNADINVSGAMSETNFNDLYRTIKNEYSINTQVNSITTAFGTAGNRFTASQASQLIQLVYAETQRLYLAKLSYKSVIDPANFSMISNLLYTQSSRDDLLSYINSQGNIGTPPNPGVGVSGRTAMSETDFNTLYQSVNMQFLPYAKNNYLTTTFNNDSYHFTTSQAKNLIQLVTNESNRLQLAKLVYGNLVDRGNYTQLYDLFATESSRTELNSYVQVYRD